MGTITIAALVLALSSILGVAVAALKGTLGMVGEAFREIVRRSGEPWTWGAFAEPALSIPVVFVTAAFGLAHPESPWARWFYGRSRIARARQRSR